MKHEFVDQIPDLVEENILYISLSYSTAVHKCVCGCGNEVVTPFSPTDWKMLFNGETVSLSPSIGNWSFPCESHYWIKDGEVVNSYKWSKKRIKKVRKKDKKRKKKHFKSKKGK